MDGRERLGDDLRRIQEQLAEITKLLRRKRKKKAIKR